MNLFCDSRCQLLAGTNKFQPEVESGCRVWILQSPNDFCDSADCNAATIQTTTYCGSGPVGSFTNDCLAGSVVGNYILGEAIGNGGGGRIFRAVHEFTRNISAVKIPQFHGQIEAALQFQREINFGKLIRHQNIVATFDGVASGGTPYLAMEHVPGPNLHDYVCQNGPLPARQAVDVIKQAATALVEVHRHGIVHRDVKPSNLLLDFSHRSIPDSLGRVKMADFGLSRQAGVYKAIKDSRISGTIDYMAPEQVSAPCRSDPRSDLYGLGCTFYFLLTGRTVFEGTPVERLMAHVDRQAPRLKIGGHGVSSHLLEIIFRMLATSVEQRPASARELIAAFDE